MKQNKSSESITYRSTLIPVGINGPHVFTCELCGSLVLDAPLHDEWHKRHDEEDPEDDKPEALPMTKKRWW